MKYVKPIDPVTIWPLLHDKPENAIFYASSLIKSTKPEDFTEIYWCPTPEDHRDPKHHRTIQKRFLTELLNLQELEKPNPKNNPESMVSQLYVDTSTEHRFDIDMIYEFKRKVGTQRRFSSVQSKLTDAF